MLSRMNCLALIYCTGIGYGLASWPGQVSHTYPHIALPETEGGNRWEVGGPKAEVRYSFSFQFDGINLFIKPSCMKINKYVCAIFEAIRNEFKIVTNFNCKLNSSKFNIQILAQSEI